MQARGWALVQRMNDAAKERDAAAPGVARSETARIRSRAFARLWDSPWSNAKLREACGRFEPRFETIWRMAAAEPGQVVVPFVEDSHWVLPPKPYRGDYVTLDGVS